MIQIFNPAKKQNEEQLKIKIRKYRRLLVAVERCKSPNAFKTVAQLLQIQKLIKEELKKEKN